MGYPETMRDVMEQVRREEIRRKRQELENQPIIDDITGFYNEKYLHLRLDEEMENITINVGIVQCDYQEDAEEFIKSASDALLKGKQKSKGK